MTIAMGLNEESKVALFESKIIVEEMKSTESIVFSKYHKARMGYFKNVGPAEDFYRAALSYLSYTPVEQISEEDRYSIGTDMALAAMVGEGLYNFGEVIATPVLKSLVGTPNQWLYDLIVKALSPGDLDEYNRIIAENTATLFAFPALINATDKISQKVVLMSLLNLVFRKPSHERTLTYAEICRVGRIPADQVDWILMRAMSLKLLVGTIDQHARTVTVTWIQPFVLDTEQIGMLTAQLEDWKDRVKRTLLSVEDQSLEMFT